MFWKSTAKAQQLDRATHSNPWTPKSRQESISREALGKSMQSRLELTVFSVETLSIFNAFCKTHPWEHLLMSRAPFYARNFDLGGTSIFITYKWPHRGGSQHRKTQKNFFQNFEKVIKSRNRCFSYGFPPYFACAKL